jgi:hypothetical protein
VRALEIATTFCLGLLAGAMLLIGGAIVPYWFSLDPSAFAAWFAQNSSFLGAVMVPLGGVTTLLALATALVSWRARSPARGYFAAAAALAVVVALVYLVEHASLNAAIASRSLSPAEVASARESWRDWHWARVGAGVLGFMCALVGLGRAGRAGAS